MRNPLRLIRIRLTLWHVLSLALLLGIFSAGVYIALRHELRDNLDATIESRADVLLRVIEVQDGRPMLPSQFSPPAVDSEDDDDELGEDELIRLYDRDGNLLLDTSDPDEEVPALAGRLRSVLDGNRRWLNVRGDDTFRVLAVPIAQDGGIVGALAVGQSEEDIEETLGTLATIVTIAYPLSILTAAAIGIFLAHRALAPIDQMTGTVRRLSADDLSQRLDMDLPDDELGRLSRTFDDMLARVDTAFRRQRQFTADASHELRTPLTIMKGEIEVALSRPRDAETYREVLEAAGEQANQLIDLVNSLLMLARADAGEIPVQREAVDIAMAVETTIDQVRPLAGEKGVALSSRGEPGIVAADLTLLLQLLFNLLENAIKHTPSGGEVRITWTVERGQLRFDVTDTGVGIAPEHLPHLFDRFYRVDAARTSSDGGVGIGLAICRWIADAHGGSISVSSEPERGSTFTVTLPADPPRS